MGFKPTTKHMVIAIAGIIVVMIIFVLILMKKLGADMFEPEYKDDYGTYKEFRDDAGSFFVDAAPASAKNFKYYYRFKDDDTITIVSFDVDDKDLIELKKHYTLEFNSLSEYDKVIEDEKMKDGFIAEEGLDKVKDFISGAESDFRIHRYARKDGSSYRDSMCFAYRKSDNKVLIFDYYIKKK